MEEPQLIQNAQRGDQDAFRQLVERYARAVWRTAHVLVAEAALAEDAVQEAWLDVWQGLPRFDATRPLRPWLLAIVANRCRKLMRRQPLPALGLDCPEALTLADAQDIMRQTLRQEADAELGAVLATLPDGQRRILELRYYAGLDLVEIALVTHAPLGTVKSRLHRALHAARTRLEQDHSATSAWEPYHE